jgi:hypothetical protein
MTKITKKYKSRDDKEIHISRAEITSLLAGVTTRRSRKTLRQLQENIKIKDQENIQTTTEINFFSQQAALVKEPFRLPSGVDRPD